MKIDLRFVSALVMGFAVSPHAPAAIFVMGNGLAQSCFQAARDISISRPAATANVQICTMALDDASLVAHDVIASHVNRGILLMANRRYTEAMQDFNTAITMDKSIGEAWINLGASLLGQKRWSEGIAALDTGLKLNPSEPEKGYFNRAIADEALDDTKSAYFDFSKAAELKPDWDQPRMELERFTVHQKPKA